MPNLYVVSTPIGNLEDITLRALRVLREVGLIASEDTRKTKTLLQHYGIKNKVVSYYEHNKEKRLPWLIERLKEIDVALVSEAGTPGMSDPGFELIKAASENNIRIIPVPGASALLAALVVSDIPYISVRFVGFLPRNRKSKVEYLENLSTERSTLIFFEAPHRLQRTLDDMLKVLGDRKVNICRELTKLYEEVFRGSISEAKIKFADPRGEFVIIVSGSPEDSPVINIDYVKKRLTELISKGYSGSDAVRLMVKESGLPRNKVYKIYLEISKRNKI